MKNIQLATFGGGCFWCIEAVVQRLNGVESVASGYSGGKTENPNYRAIVTGLTGHAEVVQVSFDSNVISYEDLVSIFMTSHDPTTLNRQGADRGTQYRSIILYHDQNQKEIANQVINNFTNIYPAPIVTEVVELDTFYIAEEYHQDYYNNNQNKGYCRVVIDPKISKLRKMYSDKLKEAPQRPSS